MRTPCYIRTLARWFARPLVPPLLSLIERLRTRCDLPLCTNCAEHFTRLARVYRKLGYNEKASERVEIALAADPKLGEAYLQRALLNLRENQGQLALQDAKRDLRVRPHNAETLYAYGNALRQIGQRHQAIKAFERAIEIKPSYTFAFLGCGYANFELQRWEEAIANINRAISLGECSSNAKQTLRQAQLKLSS